jgi:hypothetical protein
LKVVTALSESKRSLCNLFAITIALWRKVEKQKAENISLSNKKF